MGLRQAGSAEPARTAGRSGRRHPPRPLRALDNPSPAEVNDAGRCRCRAGPDGGPIPMAVAGPTRAAARPSALPAHRPTLWCKAPAAAGDRSRRHAADRHARFRPARAERPPWIWSCPDAVLPHRRRDRRCSRVRRPRRSRYLSEAGRRRLYDQRRAHLIRANASCLAAVEAPDAWDGGPLSRAHRYGGDCAGSRRDGRRIGATAGCISCCRCRKRDDRALSRLSGNAAVLSS